MNGSLAHAGSEMIGNSAAMRQLREEVVLAARSEIPVLIAGETGVGKELVALDLHRQSGRRGSFVPVNVCASSESMFEAAMFGHRRGAFTGALEDSRGFIAEADGGTLFLDEICSLSLDAQAKLLRVLESRRFRPIGGRADVVSAFRLVTATNRSLRDEVAAGRFRADLFYRLMGYGIEVPPLRERRGDITALFLHFLASFDIAGECPREVTAEARDCLVHYAWPGNVRELRHVAWHAAMRSVGSVRIEASHLTRHVSVGQSLSSLPTNIDQAFGDGEMQELVRMLMLHNWDTVAVARELGCTRKTVYARMKRLRVPTRRKTILADAGGARASSAGDTPARSATARN
jgi:transcriptional regulator with GAF, ATPase, and Fis domain